MTTHDPIAPVVSLFWGTPLAVLDGGSHKPLQCELEDASGHASKWIVKSTSMYGHGPTNILREFVGSDLAALVGLCTPAAGLLELPSPAPPQDDSPAGVRAAEILKADAGSHAFCAAWFEAPVLQAPVLARGQRRTEAFERDAIFLFCFDALFWHYDRTRINPNVLHWGDRLVAIDHDRICHGVERVDEAGNAPDYRALVLPEDGSGRPEQLREHILAHYLKPLANHPAWEEFACAAETVEPKDIDRILGRWPDELDQAKNGRRAGLKQDLKRFLRIRIQEARRIVEEARRVVA